MQHGYKGKQLQVDEVHLANHPGYDIVKHNAFFDKYGSHLLTIMYMVKNGIYMKGLVVSPLLGLIFANNADRDQQHLSFLQKNIGRLVDDTISHLKELLGIVDGDIDHITKHNPADLDLTQLMSHLKVKSGESCTGGLIKTVICEGRYAWLCAKHYIERLFPM
jgi:hypothetical protein